jgi:hypothetical protein
VTGLQGKYDGALEKVFRYWHRHAWHAESVTLAKWFAPVRLLLLIAREAARACSLLHVRSCVRCLVARMHENPAHYHPTARNLVAHVASPRRQDTHRRDRPRVDARPI